MLGTPLTPTATKILLLGSGELGKEVVIEAMRLGVECVAVDRYAGAPAMQVAHRSYTIDMLNAKELRRVIEKEKPDFIIPEIEAINTELLVKLEKEGHVVIPTARATNLTMNREGIRRLAAEKLKLKTAKYEFATTFEEFQNAVQKIGIPCVVKPIMSSSGKGQSTVRKNSELKKAWDYAFSGSRGKSEKIIVEEFVSFDFELTLLTVRGIDGTKFCPPIGHFQEHGDYRESWQPHPLKPAVWQKCKLVAKKITDALGGRGIFGVELFVKGNEVYFSEVSPRPHDTGLVTLLSQNLSEFELHVRAILGLPVPEIRNLAPSASKVLLAKKNSKLISFTGVEKALAEKDSLVRIFGKPTSRPNRRLGVIVARGKNIEDAKNKTRRMYEQIRIQER